MHGLSVETNRAVGPSCSPATATLPQALPLSRFPSAQSLGSSSRPLLGPDARSQRADCGARFRSDFPQSIHHQDPCVFLNQPMAPAGKPIVSRMPLTANRYYFDLQEDAVFILPRFAEDRVMARLLLCFTAGNSLCGKTARPPPRPIRGRPPAAPGLSHHQIERQSRLWPGK